ncbi:MAG: amino acid adenylation domain-containing protein, partial [Gammaproteobacteria bacterium PRO9]|nr:amino acid adenylation domain-containing protein [Gammaproteobacteria bacterium PRO9]
ERYLFPASFAQQRLWFLEQLDGAGPVWNTRLPVRLQGRLDVAALQAAVDDVVARHESLRTTFGLRGGEVVQSVRSTLTVPVERVRPAELAERAASTFDLREGPLLRVFLASIAPDDHILLVSSHHIVSDGWSSGVLFRDIAASYDARRCGQLPRLPELPVQYADFAAWQREWLAGPALERQLEFWRRHLEGAPAVLELPLDRPRPRLQGYRGHRVSRVLSPDLSSGLQALATAEGATLFMVLLAALNVLLSRWSGQQDLVIGTPIAGRRRTELENVVGFFANTLALRTRLAGVATFRELLRNVRADALRAFDHQDLPFEKLVEALKPVRNLAHSPIFQVLFVLQNAPWEAGRFGDLHVSPAELDPPATARFDLTVTASEYEGRLWLNLEYATDLFEQQTIERLGAGFETLLAALVADPGTALEALPAEAAIDRRRQLVEWQPAPTPLPAGLDVAGMVEAQRLRTPDAIAVECGDDRLSYRLLDARAVAIARQLVRSGWSAAGPVAICLPRSIDMLATVLAVLRLGGFYLPLDPGLPRARLHYLLEDSGARLLVTTAAERGEFAGFAGHVLDLATMDGAAADHCALPGRHGDPERPAYLIHTSGSTGRPKGVLVPERAVVNFLSSMAAAPGLAAMDRLLAVTTLSFDIAALELLLPLTVGATVVIATEEEAADPGRLIALLDAAAITVMQATPSAWRNLLTAGWQGRPGLRLLCGGEALDPALAGRLLECGAGLWNLYGPTETTIWSCIERLDQQSQRDEARPPTHDMTRPPAVGRPIANTRCYVLDRHDRPVPIGASGELWIAGTGVALGYHGLPELTAERFRPDPFSSGGTTPERMYRTGDRARWRNDGRLEILGRMDRQLKLRGYRIEPGEIEA